MNRLLGIVTGATQAQRDAAFHETAAAMPPRALLDACMELDAFRRSAPSLYERVRATLFLHAACRFHLGETPGIPPTGTVPQAGHEQLLARQFEAAIDSFLATLRRDGPNGAILSALAEGYHNLAFQTLVDQVRRSVRASRGNQWMFRVGHPAEHSVRVRRELLARPEGSLLYPILGEATPVRLDLSHSGWSDIFFLGMDYPEGARVMNISVDLGVHGRDSATRPPVESYVRVIPEPLLRLTSVDLGATKDVTDLRDLFNFGNDHLGLLKAGVIASGVIPPGFEGTEHPVADILARVVGLGMGLELVTRVNDIPKGSRLAVSTNLLASVVGVLMRATGQAAALEGGLSEPERRLAASRAILGEWLGGSGGGWQDSGGIWPGIKVIEGAFSRDGDPEFGISRGCLLPTHRILGESDLHPETAERLTSSLVLFHGGMAQNVGPILEMVTEKYLLRSGREWEARQAMRPIFDGMLAALRDGDIRALAGLTTRNWDGPLKSIIPWVTNRFTESVIARARENAGDDFWGFLMLGGMSGGGMGMFVAPERHARFRDELLEILGESKRELEAALPFAMEPVVYDFQINRRGTEARLSTGNEALMPPSYYALQVAHLVRQSPETLPYLRRAEFDHFTVRTTDPGAAFGLLRNVVSNLFRVADPASRDERLAWDAEAERIRRENGFDRIQHEQMRADLLGGRIGLARNRLPVSIEVADAGDGDLTVLGTRPEAAEAGEAALRRGEVAVLTLAGGTGSRWTTGAGVIKALNPFVHMAGCHRSFLEIHLAKSRASAVRWGTPPLHAVATSYLSDAPIRASLSADSPLARGIPVFVSPGRSIAQRLVPMVRDLAFLWEETPQELLDEQKQKVREAGREALKEWARSAGEGSDYTDNVPLQRFNPPGHWHEVANLLRNGTLARMLGERPGLTTLLLHNVDTLGASLDPECLGIHLSSGRALTFEVVPRRITDRGGGLARVNGRVRLLEGLAQPREQDELKLRHYNTMTTWISVDGLLGAFGLTREDLRGPVAAVDEAVRALARRVPTYVTIKEVKRRWGHGQEDVFPVAQFEKLWSDMTALPDVACGFISVPRLRGQQLKSPAELDPWANDGSKDHVESLCRFG